MITRALTLTASFCFFFLSQAAPLAAEPTVLSVEPGPGVVNDLSQITVTFSQPVTGVQASYLTLGGRDATGVTGTTDKYVFTFDPPMPGALDLRWDIDALILDTATPPNRFDPAIPSLHYTLIDIVPPKIAEKSPTPGSRLRALGEIEVLFTEDVTGVNAADLLVNGVAATNVAGTLAGPYVFKFAPTGDGTAQISWAGNHGIADTANNPFVAENWTVQVDAAYRPPAIRINEFLASNVAATGLKDEDGVQQDWIELYNPTASAVNLAGWSLTDSKRDPARWVFPSVTIGAGEYLVIFASAKDRKPTTGTLRMHTNFKLNSFGEYLGLYDSESPRAAVSEFDPEFPEQRNDYSYGYDSAGQLRYFKQPTPGTNNAASDISGTLKPPGVSVERGWYDKPFDLTITNADSAAEIRYTTDGSLPTESNGKLYSAALSITNTTVLRVAAFKAGILPSLSITHTYLFMEGIIQQPKNPPGFPVGATAFGGYPADYEMDPEIITNSAYADKIRPALMSLPVISIVLKTDDLFSSVNGIYTHSLSGGPAWERPCSIEFFAVPGGGKAFQANAGLQIQGNAARDPQKQPKHPMRVVFKGDYGPSSLNFKVFPDSAVTKFDTLILRADFNNSWLHWDGAQRPRGQRTRDSWMKDSMRAMGGLASHNRYTHLFINGLYWGVYDPSERPDGSFGEAYLGGEKEQYDVVNEGAAVDGGAAATAVYNTMRNISNLQIATNYIRMQQYLDITQYIDYILLHFYVGHQDWDVDKNWYTVRPKDGRTGFFYVPWDGENILQTLTDNRVSTPASTPSGLHGKLVASPEYKLAFADRVQKHFFNSGALTTNAVVTRWMNRASQVDLAVIAESARWGDYRRDVAQYSSGPYVLYTRDNQWIAEQQRLLTNYFPKRGDTVLAQLKTAGLYPSTAAPAFSLAEGQAPRGTNLTITAADPVYYTLDGRDPRLAFSNTISPAALAYAQPLTLTQSVTVKARALKGTNWSALMAADYHIDEPLDTLRFTEINYHPRGGDAFEFIEISNISPLPVDASGYSVGGASYMFPHATTIQGHETIVLAASVNPILFASRYPNVKVFGYFDGSLQNDHEELVLRDRVGNPLRTVEYNDSDPWPSAADGDGYTLELIDGAADQGSVSNWRASREVDGSPGFFQTTTGTSGSVKLGAAVSATGVTLDFNSAANQAYTLESKQALGDAAWSVVTNFPAGAAGSKSTIVQPSGQKRFFRLRTP